MTANENKELIGAKRKFLIYRRTIHHTDNQSTKRISKMFQFENATKDIVLFVKSNSLSGVIPYECFVLLSLSCLDWVKRHIKTMKPKCSIQYYLDRNVKCPTVLKC